MCVTLLVSLIFVRLINGVAYTGRKIVLIFRIIISRFVLFITFVVVVVVSFWLI